MSSGPENCQAELPENEEPWDLEALRERIRLLERGTGRAACDGLLLGLAPLDAALPACGLPLAALHEIAPGRPDWDDGPVTGFCLALLVRLAARRPGPVLWLAAGWAVHVGWDLLLHPLTSTGYAPAWYVRACVGFDLVVAAWIALRPQRETAS